MDHGYLGPDDFDLDEFRALVGRTTDRDSVPSAVEVVREIPVYTGDAVDAVADDPCAARPLMTEWARTLATGPGVLVVRGAFRDTAVVDAATATFLAIITDERATGTGGGDHFGEPGANARIWNSHEKLCRRDPATFVAYASNATIALAAEAWLGPHYQLTAQVNVVNPGGAAQRPHRDYHLGFYSSAEAMRFPVHVHQMSPMLTLQGAVAHDDMPIESGPTKVLPFSQLYRAGFALAERDDYAAVFEDHVVQLPLRKGDIVFFNPAVLHAAGCNRTTDQRRMNNLLQICSAFTRAMEWRDTGAMCRAIYPQLLGGELSQAAILRVVAAAAEGYAFPTSLDVDPPRDGLAPESQADVVRRAVAERWDAERLDAALAERDRHRPARE